MAKCPICSGEMEIATTVGIDLDVCSNCRGIWFNAENLKQVLQLQPPALAQIPFYEDLQPREDAAWDAPFSFCPDCLAALNSQRFGKAVPVITQVCPNRHGLWLDQGKLRNIKQFYDSWVKSTHQDDNGPEKIPEIVEENDERAYKSNPISVVINFKRKGQLILAACLLIAVTVTGLFLSWTPNITEARVISKEFTAEPYQTNSNEITKTFSTDLAKGTSTKGTQIQDRQTKESSINKSIDKVKQAQLTSKELQDKVLADRIDAFLASRGSPMAGTGATFVAAGNATGVNPLLSVAIAGKESSFGLHCFVPHNAFGMKAPEYRFGFATWEDGIWANSRFLLRYYGKVFSPYQCLGYCVPDHPWMEDVAAIMSAI
jgi:Zn-finger nucleic acid-binding protein